jgi:hypothetical protein
MGFGDAFAPEIPLKVDADSRRASPRIIPVPIDQVRPVFVPFP